MSYADIAWAKELRQHGDRIGREGMSKTVIKAVGEFDGSYTGAMILAGRCKAIAQAAKCDGYWTEKVNIGFHREVDIAIRHREAHQAADAELEATSP